MAAEVWRAWDGLCTEGMRTSFVWLGFEELLSPPASTAKDLPFVASPAVLVTCILVYLAVVCVSVVASKFRKQEVKRDSCLLRTFVQLHNIFLVGLSLYMCIGIISEAVANGYSFWGNSFNPSERRMAEMIHIFYVSKMYEFVDTVRASAVCVVLLCSTQFPDHELQSSLTGPQYLAFGTILPYTDSALCVIESKPIEQAGVYAVHHDIQRQHAPSQPAPRVPPSLNFFNLVRPLHPDAGLGRVLACAHSAILLALQLQPMYETSCNMNTVYERRVKFYIALGREIELKK